MHVMRLSRGNCLKGPTAGAESGEIPLARPRLLRHFISGLRAIRAVKIIRVIAKKPDIDFVHLKVEFAGNF